MRSGALERERVVHLETWAVEAVAAAAGVTTPLPMGPFPERALRPLLADTSGLDRLEAARDAVAVGAARRSRRRARRARPRVRGGHRTAGRARRGRQRRRPDDRLPRLHARPRRDARRRRCSTSCARRCPLVLYASRWWCGRVFDRGAELLGQIAHGRYGPLAPLLGQLMGAGFGLWDQMGDEQRELQRRWASRRPRDAFADWTPAWHGSAYHSADLQIAAASTDAVARGDFLVVLGDFHGGDNPLAQGVFGLRHPDPAAMMAPHRRRDRARRPPLSAAPRRGPDDRAELADVPRGRHRRDERRRAGARRAPRASRSRTSSSRTGTSRTARARSAHRSRSSSTCRSSSPRCAASTRSARADGRAQIGRLVVRRATLVGARAPGRARRPRGVGARARPPAPRLRPLAARAQAQVRRLREPVAAALARPLRARGGPLEFTEMLPGPEECWLPSDAGRHTSELRVVALAAAQP